MAFVNIPAREICCKIVYVGPGLARARLGEGVISLQSPSTMRDNEDRPAERSFALSTDERRPTVAG